MEDPKVFSRPWKISMPLYRHAETTRTSCWNTSAWSSLKSSMYGHLRKLTD